MMPTLPPFYQTHPPMRLSFKLLLLQVLWLTCLVPTKAQDYKWQAPVPAPAQNGYHSLLLPPDITGRLQHNLADIRLYDAAGKEVPYLLRTEEPVQYRKLFRPYKTVSYTHRTGCCSELIIENQEQRKINNISLLIRNADVQKQVALSGSDNRQDWYVLKAKDVLYAIENTQGTTEVKLLNFPLNDYKYLRLVLNDSSSAPLNIVNAGYYDTHSENGKYTLIPQQSISRTDSAATQKTHLHLQFPQPVYPERLELEINSPSLYYRPARLLTEAESSTNRRRGLFRKQKRRRVKSVASLPFTLTSNTLATVELPRRQAEELVIEIDNGDNAPLDITSVKAYQLNRYLVANLEAGKSYLLRFGDENRAAPVYELQHFEADIPTDVPVLEPEAASPITTAPKAKKAPSSNILIWVALAVVLAGLGLMTVRLLNEMKKSR
ncbi:DUF3999 domain-containing protein [Pontibacter qinzhouensis]|uniref:DUF3999 domain-containing protein n=1 Tax=Pontibacter qinzhouensis TaxID=2603253 RepID=A0A5C8J8Z7_9BACT|nr:DUF3999 family protein [Pontibacter qinzhouensis]TXK33888.1 DUF3999 domain-containing protein [Pontibacter qinzhouensis]